MKYGITVADLEGLIQAARTAMAAREAFMCLARNFASRATPADLTQPGMLQKVQELYRVDAERVAQDARMVEIARAMTLRSTN
jgi:hypothetical protein